MKGKEITLPVYTQGCRLQSNDGHEQPYLLPLPRELLKTCPEWQSTESSKRPRVPCCNSSLISHITPSEPLFGNYDQYKMVIIHSQRKKSSLFTHFLLTASQSFRFSMLKGTKISLLTRYSPIRHFPQSHLPRVHP